jgi:hypothetical protein
LAFFWEWTLALARTGDRAFEEFFKRWSDSFDFLCLIEQYQGCVPTSRNKHDSSFIGNVRPGVVRLNDCFVAIGDAQAGWSKA